MEKSMAEGSKSFRRRLTLAILLIAAVALVISNVMSLYMYRSRELEAARATLTELLDLMDAQSYTTAAHDLVEQFAKAAPGKRLTVISADGVVLADSLEKELGNHSDRPEVAQALRDGTGEAQRRSDTIGVVMLYEAKVFTDGTVGRAAMPLSSLYAMMIPGVLGIVIAAAAALVLAYFLARWLAVHAAQPVEAAQVAVAQVDETLQSARSEFTANVTHELKTPLTSIKGFTDMMASGMVKSEADQKRFLTMISVEVDRLITLINDILKISELEVVEEAVWDEGADAAGIAADVAEFLAPAARDAGVSLSVDGEGVTAAISPARLREVILNLAENAIKYNRPGGQVCIRVVARDGQAHITVEDTGIGIPQESLSHVFERFYRVDKGRSRAQGGTGLGLAIVKHILALYGGSVGVESTLGVGTLFTVKLPLA